jgi:hypothetical protein
MGAQPDFNLDDICDAAANDAKNYMNECADLGTAIHEAISNSFVTGVRDDTIPEDCPNIMDSFIYKKLVSNAFKFIDKFHVTPILVEKALSNDRYAGTLDLLCEMDSAAWQTKKWCKTHKVDYPQPSLRVNTLIDWKVTASYYDDMPVKLAAYRYLLKAKGYPVDTMLIARFSKETGSINIKDYTDEYDDSLITFDLACELFHHNFKKYLNELEQEAIRQRIAKIERKK